MAIQTSTLTTAVAPLVKALEARGCQVASLFAEAGLDMRKLRDPDARYPVADTRRLWKVALKATQEPALGVLTAQYSQPVNFHALGFSWLASRSLKEALSRLMRFHRMVNDAVDINLHARGAEYHITYHIPTARERPADEGVDMGMAMTLRFCRELDKPTLLPTRVDMERAAPLTTSKFTEFFGVEVNFEASENLLVFAAETLHRPLATANIALARANDQIAASYLAKHEESQFDEKVRFEIVKQLPNGEPNEDLVAQALNTSRRNLQRRLCEHDTSYRKILAQTRRELAVEYLEESEYSISEIAYLLGFSDPSNFARAFRRWTAMSPGDYRRDVLR